MHPILSTLLLAVLSSGLAAAEVFTLRDGRELTGSYDPDSGRLTFTSGRITGAITVAEKDIIARRPVTEADTAEPADADGMEDLLILTDGRELRGQYDATTEKLAVSVGRVQAEVSVPRDQIVEKRRVPIEARPDEQSLSGKQREAWLSTQLSEMFEARREAEGRIVLLDDREAQLKAALKEAKAALVRNGERRTSLGSAYRAALTRRDELIAADRNATVPTALQEEIERLQADFKVAKRAVVDLAERVDGLSADLDTLATDREAEQADIRRLTTRIEKFQQALVDDAKKP